jgi:hypothetical protein
MNISGPPIKALLLLALPVLALAVIDIRYDPQVIDGATRAKLGNEAIIFQEVRVRGECWEDLRFPATGVNPTGPADAATPDTAIPGLLFSGTAENVVHIVAQMSHSKKLGSAVSPHLHIESAGTSTNATRWHMVYQWRNIGDTLSATWVTNSITYRPSGVAGVNTVEDFTHINPPASETVSSIMQIRLIRAATDPIDNNTDAMRLIEFDIHYQKDGLGSDLESGKTY